MPNSSKRPAGMRVRRDRKGTVTYYLVRPGGEKLVLGTDFGLACLRWINEQQSRVKLAGPTTALGLLDAFEQCSLPLTSTQAIVRRNSEMAILRRYFVDDGNPRLEAIAGADAFVTWYRQNRRACSVDAVIRMFRHVWKFALQLEVAHESCPWNPLDLSKVRLQMEAADIVLGFARAPLKYLLEELLEKAASSAVEGYLNPRELDDFEYLQIQLKEAASSAVAMLGACGRFDLVPSVYQLTVGDLLALRGSTILTLVRPPGRILLKHRRIDILSSLKSPAKVSTCDRLEATEVLRRVNQKQ